MRPVRGSLCWQSVLVLLAACARPPTADELAWFRQAAAGIDASGTECAQQLRDLTRSHAEPACRALEVEPAPSNRWRAGEVADREVARQLAMLAAAEQPLREADHAERTSAARVSAGVAQAHWVAERLCRARDVARTLALAESRRNAPPRMAERTP